MSPPLQIGRRGQHDRGGRESPILSNAGYVWPWVQELDSKETKPSCCPYAPTSQAKGTPSAGGYFIPGEG